jgi:hypothetical protein
MSNGTDPGSFLDYITTNVDSATLGDIPQASDTAGGSGSFDTGPITPDYGGVGANWPNLTIPGGLTAANQGTWTGAPVVTQTGALGGAATMMGGAIARISPMVFNAIVKLSQRLGGATGSVLGYGRRVWSQLSSWAAKNPGVSLIATLTSLGLSVEEAAHFIAWGVTHKRRRRARGITGRDLRTTGRTIRKLHRYQSMLRAFCGSAGGYHRRQSFRRSARAK